MRYVHAPYADAALPASITVTHDRLFGVELTGLLNRIPISSPGAYDFASRPKLGAPVVAPVASSAVASVRFRWFTFGATQCSPRRTIPSGQRGAPTHFAA